DDGSPGYLQVASDEGDHRFKDLLFDFRQITNVYGIGSRTTKDQIDNRKDQREVRLKRDVRVDGQNTHGSEIGEFSDAREKLVIGELLSRYEVHLEANAQVGPERIRQ